MGTSANWRRLQELFEEASNLPAGQREKYLDEYCADDPELRGRVEALLSSAGQTDGFLEKAVEAAAAEPGPGQRLGPYEIVRPIGRGGMGTVYLAERADGAYRQQVAIKYLNAAWGPPELVARLRNERQILADLDHPGIARLLDGGASPAGLPYVVMEYVDGDPIDQYCRERNLTIEGRLHLFAGLCEAVAYAHRNLVIHRDIKPGNVLVTGEGRTKLLDFGIAKLLDPHGKETAGLTRPAERLMTPGYASPEQIRGEPITTSTDVYSLGALLYELLARKPAWPRAESGGSGLEQLEHEPALPSFAVRDDARLARQLAGDLDNIVLKAMHHEPARRYGSVEQLSADIRRHLAGLPVEARPDSRRYRAGKFLKRHKLGVAVAAIFVLTIAGFGASMAWLARKAQREAETSREISRFLVGLFSVSDPSEARGNSITAREVLDKGADRVKKELGGELAVRAQLMHTLGRVYLTLGLYERAQAQLTDALEGWRAASGASSREYGETLALLAFLANRQGDHSRAIKLNQECLRIFGRLSGDESREYLSLLNNLGLNYWNLGEFDRAVETYQRVVATATRLLGPDDRFTLTSRNNLEIVLADQGRYQEAEPMARDILQRRLRVLGDRHPETGYSYSNLGFVLMKMGRYEEARQAQTKSLELRRRVLGSEHADLSPSLNLLSATAREMDNPEEAAALARESLAVVEKSLGPSHPQTAAALDTLALARQSEGELQEAEELARRSLAVREKILPAGHHRVAESWNTLGQILHARGRLDEAEKALREALAGRRSFFGPRHDLVADSAHWLGQLIRIRGSGGEAAALLEEALAIRRERLPEGHPAIGASLRELGLLSLDGGNPKEAMPRLREALELHRKSLPPAHLETAWSASALARCLAAIGETSSALALRAEFLPKLATRSADSRIRAELRLFTRLP